jgi:hypothetical protein
MHGRILNRLAAPILLASGGLAAVVYGVVYHHVEVFEKTQVSKTIKIPVPFSPGGPIGGDSAFGEPGSSPGPFGDGPLSQQPAFVTKKVTAIEFVSKTESEPTLLRQMTVGGITLVRDPEKEEADLEAGSLLQTYSGDLPALCPT